jgi:hypothetical protein
VPHLPVCALTLQPLCISKQSLTQFIPSRSFAPRLAWKVPKCVVIASSHPESRTPRALAQFERRKTPLFLVHCLGWEASPMAVLAVDSYPQNAHLAWLGGRVGLELCAASALRHRFVCTTQSALARHNYTCRRRKFRCPRCAVSLVGRDLAFGT